MLSLRTFTFLTILLFLSPLPIQSSASPNFPQCLSNLQAGLNGIGLEAGGTDNAGNPVPAANATAIKYLVCVDFCGGGSESFSWSQFSNQFSAWLLPWLALLSQLPFGADDKLDNFLAVVLTIGSPTLAAYSVGLTALNGRWIARLFASSTYPNTRVATRVLSSLQQVPLRVYTQGSLLASLVVLPQNDEWWSDLLAWLNYTHTWSLSAASSIAWVLIAYIFTVVDSFTADIADSVEVNGQAVGSLWVWLLPIVVAWLQISPKCDSARVHEAVRRANEVAFDATFGPPVRASLKNDLRAIYLLQDEDPLYSDERCSAPVYNYARLFSWTAAVEEIHLRFQEATRRSRLFQPVDHDCEWVHGDRGMKVRPENRQGTSEQVVAYCTNFFILGRPSRWGSDVWGRIAVASAFALFLNWGSVGSAIVVVWMTPTTGLGCRSGAYLIYATLSTIVWALLLVSSILSHYSTLPGSFYDSREKLGYDNRAWIAASLSIGLRRFGKVVAAINAGWILTICLFQFTAFFDNCYCDSSALGRGKDVAYNVIQFLPSDISSMKGAWIGGVFLALGCATIFAGFVNVLINPKLPPSTNSSE